MEERDGNKTRDALLNEFEGKMRQLQALEAKQKAALDQVERDLDRLGKA